MTTANETAYQEGERSAHADWRIAFDDLWVDGAAFSPEVVAHEVSTLRTILARHIRSQSRVYSLQVALAGSISDVELMAQCAELGLIKSLSAIDRLRRKGIAYSNEDFDVLSRARRDIEQANCKL